VKFLDTNIIIYAVTDDDYRCDRAIEVLGQGGIVSAQIMSELTNTLMRKFNLRWRDIEEALDKTRAVVDEIRPVTAEIHAVAVTITRDHKVSWFDALIVSSALEAGCSELVTEDLQHGRKFGRMKIVNPFI
jgi:predicted nucleic acid-binding protein